MFREMGSVPGAPAWSGVSPRGRLAVVRFVSHSEHFVIFFTLECFFDVQKPVTKIFGSEMTPSLYDLNVFLMFRCTG